MKFSPSILGGFKSPYFWVDTQVDPSTVFPPIEVLCVVLQISWSCDQQMLMRWSKCGNVWRLGSSERQKKYGVVWLVGWLLIVGYCIGYW